MLCFRVVQCNVRKCAIGFWRMWCQPSTPRCRCAIVTNAVKKRMRPLSRATTAKRSRRRALSPVCGSPSLPPSLPPPSLLPPVLILHDVLCCRLPDRSRRQESVLQDVPEVGEQRGLERVRQQNEDVPVVWLALQPQLLNNSCKSQTFGPISPPSPFFSHMKPSFFSTLYVVRARREASPVRGTRIRTR